MGYRLTVVCKENPTLEYYGTKLYGYLDGEEFELLKSAKFLKRQGIMDGDEYFGYGFYTEYTLTFLQFKRFAELYEYDMKYGVGYYGTNNQFEWGDDMRKIIDHPGDKIISWG